MNFDKAAHNSLYPGIEKKIKEAMYLHRPASYGEGYYADTVVSAAIEEIADHLRFKPEQISFFNSASSAIRFVVNNLNKSHVFSHYLEHKCSSEITRSITFKELDLLSSNCYFIVSLKNNELGWEIPADIRVKLMNRKFKLILDITGANFNDPLIDSADIVFASSGKWQSFAGCGLLASRVEFDTTADRFTNYGLGSPNTIGILSLAGSMNWLANKGAVREEIYLEIGDMFSDMAVDLGWKINGQGPGIINLNCGHYGKLFAHEMAEKGVTISLGAACAGGADSSKIIEAINPAAAKTSIRVSWDYLTTIFEAESAIKIFKQVHKALEG